MSIKGLDDRTDVLRAVQQGGRFVVYEYCISIVILTFRRRSAVQFIPAGQDRIGPGLPYTLLSLVAGWWGFPFGPIFTIMAIWNNSRGGKDVTGSITGLMSQAARSVRQQ